MSEIIGDGDSGPVSPPPARAAIPPPPHDAAVGPAAAVGDAETGGPKFNRGLFVGSRDRGMGRGDYAVVRPVGGRNHVVAKLFEIGLESGHVPPHELQPVRANAFLFAAAPELYDVCALLLPKLLNLKLAGHQGFDREIPLLEAALAKAVPHDQAATPSRTRDGQYGEHALAEGSTPPATAARSDGLAPEGDQAEPERSEDADTEADDHPNSGHDHGGEG
jgi:hypothetical protein